MIIGIGIAVTIYLALLYVAPGPDKSLVAQAPVNGAPKVFRNLVLAIVGLILADGVVFHSSFYTTVLKPKSHAGVVANHLRAEKRRPRIADKEILVIGDSRVEQGFDSEIANEMARGKGVAFIERAVPASGPRMWHYFLRELDPRRARYHMIVVPLAAEEMQNSINDRSLDIMRMAPLLRYSDAFSFASSFYEWRNQARAFATCILRGSAYQNDLFDLLENPHGRVSELQRPVEPQQWGHAENRNRTLAGLVIDPVTGEIQQFPEDMLERQRERLQHELRWVRRRARFSGENFAWSKQIVERYASSPTTIVFVRLPRGPFLSLLRGKDEPPPSADEAWLRTHAVVLDHRTFRFLEAPEYFVDTKHLNKKGQELFTKRLTEELLGRLQIRSARSTQATFAGPDSN